MIIPADNPANAVNGPNLTSILKPADFTPFEKEPPFKGFSLKRRLIEKSLIGRRGQSAKLENSKTVILNFKISAKNANLLKQNLIKKSHFDLVKVEIRIPLNVTSTDQRRTEKV